MTDEEIENLMQEASEQIDKLSDPEKPLTKKEKNRKAVLQLQREALKKMKLAREKGNMYQEMRATLDYTLITNYAEKHPFWAGFIKSQMGWWWGF
jgi:hypothetical protein